MLTRILLAVLVPALFATSGFAQQVFLSFEQGNAARSSTDITTSIATGSGSAFVYFDNNFDVDAFDLNFSTSDDSVIALTGVQIFNPEIVVSTPTSTTFLGPRYNEPTFAKVVTDLFTQEVSGRLIGVAVTTPGIDPELSEFDPGFDEEADAFLIARIDYDILGTGTADINLELGELEFFTFDNPTVLFQPTIASGSVTVVAVPEPSTMGLLALGLAGFVARRRR